MKKEIVKATPQRKKDMEVWIKNTMDNEGISRKGAINIVKDLARILKLDISEFELNEARSTETFLYPTPHVGDTIRIIKMDDNNGIDTTAQLMAGREGIIKQIADNGDLWGTWGSLAVIPGVDQFEIIATGNEDF